MIASYKEAGKTRRKWFFSVLVAFALVFSFLAPSFLTTQGTVYAEKQRTYDIVVYGADGVTEVGRSQVSSVAGMFNVNSRFVKGTNTIEFVDAYGERLQNQDNGGFLGGTRYLGYVSPVTVGNMSLITDANGNPSFTVKILYGDQPIVTAVSRESQAENGVYVANTVIDPKVTGNIETSTTNPDGVVVKQDNVTADSTSSEGKTPREECISSGKAGSLGWIVCPVLIFLSDSANDLYEAIEPYLEVDTNIFDFGGSGGTFEAWRLFQRFANIAFVILFMVVVISQVTGVGINNYGIKKILPKLIVTAVLVNVSYWLCLIVVDISNIVGNSIQNLFVSMGPAYAPSGSAAAVIGVSVMIALLGGGIAIVLNPAVILGLLISAIGLVVSLLTLLVLLAMREAIVVVLVVAAPLAIVCYMLPNTKKVFDKWVKVAEGMLLLYPTASLLVGAGSFVSRLMMSTEAGQTFFGAFVAILVSIVPIFFIPKLLTSAFAAVGNIGAKVSGIGKNLGGRAQNATRNSAAFRDAQRRGAERRTRIMAGIGTDGKPKEMGRIGKALRGGERNIADARAQFLKDQVGRQRADSMNGDGFDAAQIDQQKAFEKQQLGEWITLVNDRTRNGDKEDVLFAMYDEAMAEGNKFKATAVARIAGRRKDTAARFLDQKITGLGLENQADRENLYRNNQAHADVFQGVAKEIATGDNSAAYRESSPVGFQFASTHHKTADKDENGRAVMSVTTDYESWSKASSGEGGPTNVGLATNNYITNTKELMGAKNKALNEIADAMANPDGRISDKEFNRLKDLAQLAIQNKGVTGTWDSTKEEVINRIANMSRPTSGGTPTPTGGAPAGGGRVGEGELDLSGSHGSGSGGGPTPPVPPAPGGGTA